MNECRHGVIAAVLDVVGICENCHQLVDLQMVVYPDGRKFQCPDGDVADRTEGHPANIPGYVEISPRLWVWQPLSNPIFQRSSRTV